jgi:alkylation response protein AidB-like acyl-CoA dehydrogenase
MRVNGLRTISALAGGHDPGPSASINKMFWSEYSQAFTEFAANILGPRAIAGEQLPRWTQQLLGNRSNTIWGGTAEVQRNIVAERILGLPKDP